MTGGATNTMGVAGVFGWSAGLPCARLFRFWWFLVAWGLVTLIGGFVASGPRYGLRRGRPFWIGMFAVSAVLFMLASDATLSVLDVSSFAGDACTKVAVAGSIASAATSVLLLMSIGTDWEGRRRGYGGRGPHGRGGRGGGYGHGYDDDKEVAMARSGGF